MLKERGKYADVEDEHFLSNGLGAEDMHSFLCLLVWYIASDEEITIRGLGWEYLQILRRSSIGSSGKLVKLCSAKDFGGCTDGRAEFMMCKEVMLIFLQNFLDLLQSQRG